MEHQANTTPEAVPKRRTRKWFIVLLILLGLTGIVIALLIPAVQASLLRTERVSWQEKLGLHFTVNDVQYNITIQTTKNTNVLLTNHFLDCRSSHSCTHVIWKRNAYNAMGIHFGSDYSVSLCHRFARIFDVEE